MTKSDKAFDELMRAHAGKGSSDKIVDRVSKYEGEDWRDRAWLLALQALDERGDKAPLKALLRSDSEITPTIRGYLADLVERGIALPGGGQRTPAYDYSPNELRLFLAVEDARNLIRRGAEKKEALKKVAETYRVDVRSVKATLAGEQGNMRHIMKRMKEMGYRR
jgi:hypothetical protein